MLGWVVVFAKVNNIHDIYSLKLNKIYDVFPRVLYPFLSCYTYYTLVMLVYLNNWGRHLLNTKYKRKYNSSYIRYVYI